MFSSVAAVGVFAESGIAAVAAMRLFSDTQEAAEADEDAVDSDCGESMLMKMSAGRM